MTQTASKPQASTWNTVTFTGNLGKDPEMIYTPNGNTITKFSLAVSQGKDKPPMWLNVECWKQLAEQCNSKLTKGTRIELEGRLVQDSWQDKEGKKRYALKVVAQTVKLLKRSSEISKASGFIEEDDNGFDPLGDLEDHPF